MPDECHIYKQSGSIRQLQSDVIRIHFLKGCSRTHSPKYSRQSRSTKKCYLLVGLFSRFHLLCLTSCRPYLCPFLVSATVASLGTKSDCQCDVKLYFFLGGNVLLRSNRKDIILSERSAVEMRGEGVPWFESSQILFSILMSFLSWTLFGNVSRLHIAV